MRVNESGRDGASMDIEVESFCESIGIKEGVVKVQLEIP